MGTAGKRNGSVESKKVANHGGGTRKPSDVGEQEKAYSGGSSRGKEIPKSEN